MKLDRNGQARIIVVLILILIVASVLYLTYSEPEEEGPVRIAEFKVRPSEFKISERGELVCKIENLIDNDFATIIAYFETHVNVELYLGDDLLDITGNNYTYTKILEPKETTNLIFSVKAVVDVGDSRRDYQVKSYFYVNDNFFGTKIAKFSVLNE